MVIRNIIIAFCSFSFFMIGFDKFLAFLEPPCSLLGNINLTFWKVLGVMQIAAGMLIWLPKYRKIVTAFFTVFMLAFTTYHLAEGTYDIGGSVFMALLLGLLYWNPSFMDKKSK